MSNRIGPTIEKTGSPRTAYGMMLLQAIVFGFGDPISKIAYDSMPVYSLLFARFTIAFGFLMLFFGRSVMADLKSHSIRSWILPAVCTGLSYLFGNMALGHTEATTTAFLRSLPVVMAPVLSLLIFRKPYRLVHLLIQLMAVLGLYLLCVWGGLSGFGPGEVLALLAALMLAGALVFGEQSVQEVSSTTLTAVQCGLAALISLFMAVTTDHGLHYSGNGPVVWMIILYLAIICSVLGFWLQNASLESISPQAVALIQAATPVMTAIFSRILLKETLTLPGIIGSVIILLSVVLGTIVSDKGETRQAS